ncbi:hypothetical protein ACJX0J_026893, partial [Zea mays]
IMIKIKHLLHERINHLTWLFDLELILIVTCSSSKAVEVLEAYEGTLEDDYPPENERYEHNEMLLYKYDRHFVAMYELGKKMTTAISIEDVRREVKILKALFGHSNLVKFYDACEDALNVYIIMDTLTLYMVAGHSGHKLNQIREKYLSLKKGTRPDITTTIEDVTSLSHVEAKKRYEFLEAVSATMDSDLRYFKQGYELLHQMEPYINQVRSLTVDVRVWEPSVINLFQSLGNMFVNSIWEETLPDDNS